MLTLSADTVHLWYIELDRTNIADYTPFMQWLSENELNSARRIRVAEGHERYIGARASLRWILSHYIDCEPDQIHLQYGPSGKPRLQSPATVGFNLSHCGDELLCAVSAHEVGVDIELSGKPIDAIGLSRRFFAPREAELVASAGEPASMFYRFWTCKEAVLKAQGCGLYRHLSDVVIEITSDKQPEIHSLPQDFRAWNLYQWETGRRYFALGVAKPVRYWQNKSLVLSSLY